MAEKSDMNKLLRAAAFGVSADEVDAQLSARRQHEKVTDMNALLRAARGRSISEEVDGDAAE